MNKLEIVKKGNTKKSNRRSKVKYPALKPNLNLKSRYDELTDFDYLHKLNDKEKEFMNSFLEESVNANFNHSGKILHNTKKLRKACYDRNNSRNRDILSRAKASGRTISLNSLAEGAVVVNQVDKIISDLDKK